MAAFNAVAPFVIVVIFITKGSLFLVCYIVNLFRKKWKTAADVQELDSVLERGKQEQCDVHQERLELGKVEREHPKLQFDFETSRRENREFDEKIRKLWHQHGDQEGDHVGGGDFDGDDRNSQGHNWPADRGAVTKVLSAIDRGLVERQENGDLVESQRFVGLVERQKMAVDVIFCMNNLMIAQMRRRLAEAKAVVELAGSTETAADESDAANSSVIDDRFLDRRERVADVILEVLELEPRSPKAAPIASAWDVVGWNEIVEIVAH